MNAQKFVVICCALGFAAWILALGGVAHAQLTAGEAMAGTEGMNTLNGGGGGVSASSGVGAIGLDRARNAVGQANANGAQFNQYNQATGGGMPMNPNDPNAMGAPGAPQGLNPQQANGLAQRAMAPKITVIAGIRVFDAVTGELVDDAIRRKVPETDKDKGGYYDDGTHGDMTPNDGIYTRIDGEKRDAIGASNQKVKEQLIQALRVAEGYSPVEFYGFSLMSTDRTDPVPRNETWKVVKDPRGLGYMLKEEPSATPISVPKYRDKLKEKDKIVKEDWAYRFLQEYRKKKDDLASDFFPVYIPQPPQPPSTMPPASWMPFSDPNALARQEQARRQTGGLGSGLLGGGGMGGGMMGGGMMGGEGMMR